MTAPSTPDEWVCANYQPYVVDGALVDDLCGNCGQLPQDHRITDAQWDHLPAAVRDALDPGSKEVT